jgi:hypothetical protein
MHIKYSALLCLLFLFFSTSIFAQRPQKILGPAKEDKSINYYKEQSQLWQKVIKKEPKNGDAWVNYYKAERALLQLSEPKLFTNHPSTFYQRLQPILSKAKAKIQNTFDYHYIRGLNSDGDQAIQALQKAYSIDPDRSEIYGWLLVHYVPRLEQSQVNDLCQRMLKANIYSNANLTWNYNALQSIEKNGIIISNGDMDGMPKWVLQYGDNVRPDVLCLSKWLLAQYDDYRKDAMQKAGINRLAKKASDFETMSGYADYLAAAFLKQSKRPAYISAGTPIQFFRDHGIEDQIYLVGNALKYSETAFDNTEFIKKNVEEKYFLEYLFNNFQKHSEDEVVKGQMNLTYLPAFIHLKKHYQKLNKSKEVAHYDQLIQHIATESGRKEEVLNWFK